MDDLFIIAAGGSGAKVVESFVHLCAAGLCPPKVHILLVDGDASNGNRQRAIATWDAFKNVQGWPWRVEPATEPKQELALFNTELQIYPLAEKFSATESGSLRPLVQDDEQLYEALSVVLDDQELDTNMRIGFTGRPNLGCLVMSRYLQRHLRNHDRARAFVQALEDSARTPNAHPRIAVLGSVFGGTGASLLPVARACIKGVFSGNDANNQPRTELYERMLWGKIMLLPFFRPQGGVSLGTVNPARHFVDTSGALWYYAMGQSLEEPTYVVGSDSPELRKTIAAVGEVAQNNPAFYHELLAGLAILDFCAAPKVENSQPIRHFSAVSNIKQDGNMQKESCTLSKLPTPRGMPPDFVQDRLALMLHLAAFSLDWRESTRIDFQEYCRGLFQYSKTAILTGWANEYYKKLANERSSLQSKEDCCHQLLKYYTRFVLWGTTALPLSLGYNEAAGQYASLHNTLCQIKPGETDIKVNGHFPEENDNLAAKISRLALAGLRREDASRDGLDFCQHGLDLGPNQLLTQERTVKLGIAADSIAWSLQSHGFDRHDIEKWHAEFRVLLPEEWSVPGSNQP